MSDKALRGQRDPGQRRRLRYVAESTPVNVVRVLAFLFLQRNQR